MKEKAVQKTMLACGAAATLAFCLTPFLYMLLTALAAEPDFLLPHKSLNLTLDNLRAVFCTPSVHLLAYLRNSLIISAVSAACSVFLASLAAYAVTRLPLPGKAAILFGVLGISMFPPVSMISYLFKLMSALGWINTYMALIPPYIAWTMPISLWILVSYFSRIPRELDRSGRIDGASHLQILTRIILPVAAPGVFSTMLLAFIFTFNEFLFALMLTVDESARTVPVAIAQFQGLHGRIPWGQIMAAAAVTILPVVLLTFVFQRRIVQGLTRGAVKE